MFCSKVEMVKQTRANFNHESTLLSILLALTASIAVVPKLEVKYCMVIKVFEGTNVAIPQAQSTAVSY